jgi:hypothetical protein
MIDDRKSVKERKPAAPVTLTLGEAVGKMVVCPDCGQPALVEGIAGLPSRAIALTSRIWTVIQCSGWCGRKQFKSSMIVQLQPQPDPQAVRKPLGEVVGQLVLCPIEDCGLESQAVWDADRGHAVTCPVHQMRAYAPSTMVVMS